MYKPFYKLAFRYSDYDIPHLGKQVEPMQVFLLFVWDPVKEETYFDRLKAGG